MMIVKLTRVAKLLGLAVQVNVSKHCLGGWGF
jgi:hypothetical protein